MKCKSFLNIDRSSGISSMPRAVRSQKDQRQEVRITRLGDHKTRWSCDYNSPPPHVIPAAAWLRCKYEKSVIRKSTRICPFNAKNRQDYSTASERLLEESRKYTKQPILLPGHCNQVDHKSLIISDWQGYHFASLVQKKQNVQFVEEKNMNEGATVSCGMSQLETCPDPKIPLLWEQGKGWERLHSSCASDDDDEDDDFVSCADICHLLSFFFIAVICCL